MPIEYRPLTDHEDSPEARARYENGLKQIDGRMFNPLSGSCSDTIRPCC